MRIKPWDSKKFNDHATKIQSGVEPVVFLAGLDYNYVEIFVVLRDSVYGSLSKRPPLLLLAYGPIFKQYTWTNPPCSVSI